MDEAITIVGYGAVGRATVERLCGLGRAVRVAQRAAPSDLPPGATFRPCDALNPESVRQAIEGSAQVVLAIGFPYFGRVWKEAWPRTLASFVDACAEIGARLVFVDNLYMYGPCEAPMIETTPLNPVGVKPAARVAATRIWMEAAKAGRLKVAALRAPDFYGPGVTLSVLGERGLAALAAGKSATLIGSADLPHDIAYVPDIARAVVTLLDAPDDAFGQAWHVPCAPARTLRQVFAIGAAALGVKLKINVLPFWALPALGLFLPQLRELSEMKFIWDRPYKVDSTKFARRFWADATPFETGAPVAALSFRTRAKG